MKAMYRARVIAVSFALILLLGGPAFAGSALHGLVINQDNQFEDDNWETLHPNYTDGDTLLEVGEVLVGIFEVDSRQSPIPLFNFINHGASFTGVFMVQVEDVTVTGGIVADYTFSPAPAAAWTALGFPAPAAGTMIRIFDDTTLDGSGNVNTHDDFVNATAGTLAAALASAIGNPVADFGIVGGLGSWTASITDTDGSPTDLTATWNSASFEADLVLTANYVPSITWVDVDALAGYQQLALRDGTLTNTGDRLNGVNVFGVASTTRIYVHPTPEPSSFVLMVGVGAGILAWRRRLG